MIRKDAEQDIRLEAERLASGTLSDFAAIALPAERFGGMKWDVVVGSRDGRIKQMRIKPGIGLGGMVMRHGIHYMVNDHHNPSMRGECPVMLAEKLESGMAFPLSLLSGQRSSCGVLLLGRRTAMYREEDAVSALPLIKEMLKSRWLERYDRTTIR